MFNWLTIELTNRCNKSCWFCGRAKMRDNGTMRLGDIDINLFRHIIKQYEGDILQFSRDGEPLLYEKLDIVGNLSRNYFTNIVTNGELLLERKKELRDFDTITVSVMRNDGKQLDNVKNFIKDSKNQVLIKFLGKEKMDIEKEYKKLGLKTMRRIIHSPNGDWDYENQHQLIPEIGICLDFMMKPSINWEGDFFICNRFDPDKYGKIGNISDDTIENIWKSHYRNAMLQWHRSGNRIEMELCRDCQFWGIPRYI